MPTMAPTQAGKAVKRVVNTARQSFQIESRIAFGTALPSAGDLSQIAHIDQDAAMPLCPGPKFDGRGAQNKVEKRSRAKIH